MDPSESEKSTSSVEEYDHSSDEDFNSTATNTIISGDEFIAHEQDTENGYLSGIDVKGLPKDIIRSYQLIEKSAMGVGGDGTPGDERVSPNSTPLYGELSLKSIVQVVNFLKNKANMDDKSLFLDVGSGRGLPSIFVSLMSDVYLSYGIEIVPIRYQLSMHALHAVCKNVQENENEMRGCYFQQLDFNELKTFDPFTHIYCYSTG